MDGPSSARQRNETFKWRFPGGPALNAGLVAFWFYRGSGPVLLRNPIFCDFSGGGVRTPVPPLDPYMSAVSPELLLLAHAKQGRS